MADPGARLSGLRRLLDERRLAAGRVADPDPAGDPEIASVALDSRRVGPGSLFAALPGRRADGRTFAREAVARGAVAVLTPAPIPGLGVPQVVAADARASLAVAAAWLAGFPSRELGIVGITGTDGKTTTAYLVRAALESDGRTCGLVGTTEVIVGGRSLGNPARTTTPEAPELQAHLAAMRDAGDAWAVIESTSHGLAQHRVGEIAYDVAVLTNVTSEHLEFHGTREAYLAAKRSLFERLARGRANPDKGLGKHAVINADDPEAGGFVDAARGAGASILTYGLLQGPGRGRPGSATGPSTPGERRPSRRGRRPVPDITGRDIVQGPRATSARVRTPRWEGPLELRLAGRFNVANALAALGVVESLGLDPAAAVRAMAALGSVPGRMQRIDQGQPFGVVVDYAHTAEALATVLDELRPPIGGGDLIAVFGSAGERDTQKRPVMGRVAGERCRLVVITDEDPRGEDRLAIIEAIADGVRSAGRRDGVDLHLVPDRASAIALAIAEARPGDVVLLAGKGHERTIETARGAEPWDEAAAAIAALEERGFSARRRPRGPSARG